LYAGCRDSDKPDRGLETFYAVFQEVFRFPYGLSGMDGWIDYMSSVDDPEDGFIPPEYLAGPGEVLTLRLEEAREFAARCPEQYDALTDCAGFVNWRRMERGERPILALAFNK
jgi:hypothetical protein